MTSITVPEAIFKYQRRNSTDISYSWHNLLKEERYATEAERGLLARRRTELLADVPQWDLPRILDELSRPLTIDSIFDCDGWEGN